MVREGQEGDKPQNLRQDRGSLGDWRRERRRGRKDKQRTDEGHSDEEGRLGVRMMAEIMAKERQENWTQDHQRGGERVKKDPAPTRHSSDRIEYSLSPMSAV